MATRSRTQRDAVRARQRGARGEMRRGAATRGPGRSCLGPQACVGATRVMRPYRGCRDFRLVSGSGAQRQAAHNGGASECEHGCERTAAQASMATAVPLITVRWGAHRAAHASSEAQQTQHTLVGCRVPSHRPGIRPSTNHFSASLFSSASLCGVVTARVWRRDGVMQGWAAPNWRAHEHGDRALSEQRRPALLCTTRAPDQLGLPQHHHAAVVDAVVERRPRDHKAIQLWQRTCHRASGGGC